MARLRVRPLLFLVALAIFAAIIYRWISVEQLLRQSLPDVVSTPTPEPTPTKPPAIGGKIDTNKIFNGLTFHSAVETPPGTDATTERQDPDSYVVELKLRAHMPAPNKTVDELAKVNPSLPKLLPGLASMITPESVSPLFEELYATKVKALRDRLNRLDLLLSRHNFYDCQTVLELRHPQSRRRTILVQADMDVDADGSDADRMPAGAGAPTNFKPFTSYRWSKKTAAANPYLAPTQQRMSNAEGEVALVTTPPDRKRELRAAITQMRLEIETLNHSSFLIGTTDPFIVIPGSFAKGRDAAKVGDYAVVIYGEGIYPALVGDIGPNDKVGEASLRIAKEINNAATAYSRPISDLKATYLIFPGTADTPWGPPDYEKLQARCQKLIDEIGGASVPLHHWENILTPTPSPTPAPTAPSPDASPASTFAFPVESASPSPTP